MRASVIAIVLGVTSVASAQTARPPLPSPPPEIVEAQRRYEECVAQNPDAMKTYRAGHQVRQLVEIRNTLRQRSGQPPVPGIPTLAEVEAALSAEFLEYLRLGGTASSPDAIAPEKSPCPTLLESMAEQRNQPQTIELRKRVIVPAKP